MLMRSMPRVVFVLLITAMIFVTGIPEPSYASGTVYYVSSSGGSDSNNGTSPSTPWSTLSKASSHTFGPGDQLLLKSGDVWTDTLILNGSGTASAPILLSSYGEGERPHIRPNAVESIAIRGTNVHGWQIKNLELSHAKEGIDLAYDHSFDHDYMWIEDIYFHDMGHSFNTRNAEDLSPEDLDRWWDFDSLSTGIIVRTEVDKPGRKHDISVLPDVLTNLTIRNTSFYRVDNAINIGATLLGGFVPSTEDYGMVNGLNIENVHIQTSGMFGVGIKFVRNALIRNVTVDDNGYESVRNGSASVISAFSENIHWDRIFVSNQHRHPNQSFDASGFDFEGENITASLTNSTFAGVDGYGMMLTYNSGFANTDVTVSNNQFVDFSRNYPTDAGAIQWYHLASTAQTGTIENNRYITRNGNLPIYSGDYEDAYPYNSFENNMRVLKTSLASGMTAAASSTTGASSPSYAFDCNSSTAWVAGGASYPQWLQVDLGSSQPIGYVTNQFVSAGDTRYYYQIEGSNDLSNWITLADKTVSGVLGPRITEKVEGTYRYVRIVFTGSSDGNWASSTEFEIWSPDRTGTARVDDMDAEVTYSSGWIASHTLDDYYNNDSGHHSYQANATAEFTFEGTGVAWIGAKNTDHGIANVYIDGILDQQVDTYAPTYLKQQILYQKSGLAAGTHTIKVEVTNQKNASSAWYYQDVDAFEVLDAPNQAVSLLSPSVSPTASSTYATSSTAASVDGDPSTYWIADGDSLPQWLTVDLGASHKLSRAEINFYANETWKYKLEGSNDNATWDLLSDRSLGVNTQHMMNLLSGSYRYVRLTVLGSGGDWVSVREFAVYGE